MLKAYRMILNSFFILLKMNVPLQEYDKVLSKWYIDLLTDAVAISIKNWVILKWCELA